MSINVKIGSAPQPVMQDTTIGVSINSAPKVGVNIVNSNIHEIKFKLNREGIFFKNKHLIPWEDIKYIYNKDIYRYSLYSNYCFVIVGNRSIKNYNKIINKQIIFD